MKKNKNCRKVQTNWAELEFADADLKDKRLKDRLIKIANSFSESPECPINQSCIEWSDTKAAYRFFQNNKIKDDNILRAHVEKSIDRANIYETVLCIQDTSFFTYTTHKKTTGLGIIAKHGGAHNTLKKSEGVVMHTAFGVSTTGLPIGIFDQSIIARQSNQENVRSKREKREALKVPIEEKESFRWIEALRNTHQAVKGKEVKIVTICDREGDFYDLFEEAKKLDMPILIRSNGNRVINKKSIFSRRKSEKLSDFMPDIESCGEFEIEIPAKENIPSRVASLQLSFSPFTMNPPATHFRHKTETLPNINLFAIYATELNPPKDTTPIEWMLVTNLPVNNFSDSLEKVKWYCLRWRIEVFHKVLKSGLKVEECRLQSADRLIRYLTVMSIVAWRIYKINLLARENPELPCDKVLADDEWKVLYCKFKKTQKIPKQVPTIYEAVRWIAKLGGFLGRKGDGEPGTLTLWRGWKRLFDLTEGWKMRLRF